MAGPSVKIFGWMGDTGGCGWYRIQEPLRVLAKHGHTTLASPALPMEWRDTADVIIGQRIYLDEITEMWRKLDVGYFGRRPKLVYELDDDLWHIDPTNEPAYTRLQDPGILANIRANIIRADLVTVTTPALAEIVAEINPHVVVIPNYIPRALLRRPTVPAPGGDGTVTIGWAGTPSHAGDFTEVAAPLDRVLRHHRRAEYHHLGRPPLRTTGTTACSTSCGHSPPSRSGRPRGGPPSRSTTRPWTSTSGSPR
jgi:hypothetical protein